MNEYGAMARDHYRRWRPASYAEITDPESYFTDLGDRVPGRSPICGPSCAPGPGTRQARTTSPGSGG